MLLFVKELKRSGLSVSILSDQTNWLDEIDRHEPIFHLFDHIFNSYHTHISKRTPSLFTDICSRMGYEPDQVLFVDDNPDNTERARREGLKTILYENFDQFRAALKKFM
jgi:putative hydrolase of the HAD superfamily